MILYFNTDGPDKPKISLTPQKTMYFAGDSLTIQCTTDSNPPPVFIWNFRPKNKIEEMPIIEHANKTTKTTKIVFDRIQTKNAGTYTCTVINSARPNYPNMTSFVSINVQHSERTHHDCNQCGYMETCQQSNERTVCNFNIWVPITMIFILLSVAFVVSSSVLIMKWKRTHANTTTNKILVEKRYHNVSFTFVYIPCNSWFFIILLNIARIIYISWNTWLFWKNLIKHCLHYFKCFALLRVYCLCKSI